VGFTTNRRSRSGRSRAVLVALSLGLASLVAAGPAVAADSMPAPPALPDTDFGFTTFKAGAFKTADGSNDDPGSVFTQAGGHPDFVTSEFMFNNKTEWLPSGTAENPVYTPYDGETYGYTKDIRVDIPAGMVADATAFPTCTDEQLDNMSLIGVQEEAPNDPIRKGLPGSGCPVDSQVGTQWMRARATIFFGRNTIAIQLPVYNMTRSKDQVARFAVNPRQVPLSFMTDGNLDRVDMVAGVRPSDNGVYLDVKNLPTNPLLVWSKLSLWGVPGAPQHDVDRNRASLAVLTLAGPDPFTDNDMTGNAPASDKTAAFLSNPTSCDGPQPTTMRITSTKGKVVTASDTPPVGGQGCEDVPFAPTTTFGPSELQADAPTPLSVTLDVPQSEDGGELATAHVKDVALRLPPGMSISPSAANGLEACSDRDLGQGTDDEITCPAASKVGKVTVDSPLLDDPLEGSVFIGQPQAGQRYRLFVTAEGRGISIRLKGKVDADPSTGQLTTTFRDNPQMPFSRMKLDFDGGSKAVIATPQTCGTVSGTTTFSPWSGAESVTTEAPLTITGCNGFGFSPGFGASLGSLQSGAFSPLSVSFSRPDGDQYLGGISASLPRGMTAKLKGVQRCSEDDIAAESCPRAAQIGTVSTKAGPGASPYALDGPVYLTNGYKGGSFGMVAIIRAIAGPYDLGNVVVRQSLRIDPETSQVTVVSDPLPQIKEGVVLRLRDLSMNISRAGFLRNPTSCGVGEVAAALSSPGGATAHPTSRMTFSGCQGLKFEPKLKLAVSNKTQMGKFKHPRLTAVVTQGENQAGLKSTSVTLPKAFALAADNAQGLCETADALADKCPKASIVGSAVAETPILDKSLAGPVYFVKGERKDPKTGRVIKTLPTLYVALRGETAINLRATTSVVRKQLVTTFPAIPDQPISRFTLNVNGGKHGIIATTTALCGTKQTGKVAFRGQNGAATKASSTIGNVCAPTKKASKAKKATKKASSKK
jgi:hypothetical protein